MSKYHLSDNGPAVCHASIRNCPIGGDHFVSKKDALKAHTAALEMNLKVLPSSIQKPSKVFLSSNWGSVEVIDGDLEDARARQVLISGLCGDLAKAISDKNGQPPVFVFFNNQMTSDSLILDFKENKKIIFQATHVMVRSKHHGEMFLDSYGVKSLEDVEEMWESCTVVEGTKEMISYWSHSKNDIPDLSKFANTVCKFDEEGISFEYDDFEAEEDFEEEEGDY